MTQWTHHATAHRSTLGWTISLRGRAWIATAATLLAIGLFWLLHRRIDAGLGHASVYSGASLLASLLMLVLIGARKRLIVLPLWSVSCWLQIHIYTGLFATAVFVVHVPKIVANGWFEGGLSWLFLAVSASGFYGLFASRAIPRRLTAISIQPRYDRIAWHRAQYLANASAVFDQLDQSSDATVLSQFYRRVLQGFFTGGIPLRQLIWPSLQRRSRVLAELGDLRRYLGGQSLQAADRLAALVRQRDELDYHHALQFRLRAWVTAHAALSCVLVLWSLVHAVLALSMLGD